MSEQNEPEKEEATDYSSVDYEELLRKAQEGQPETEAPSPERQRSTRESLSVTFLNTNFSGVFEHPGGLDGLLLQDEGPCENAVFGFSEVTHSQRPKVRAALEARGYQVVEPPEDSHLDLIWAVGPGLQIAGSDAHHFPRTGLRKVASRTGSETYRHVGVQDLAVTTPQGNKVRLGQERLSPWIVEPVRRMQLRDMGQVLREQFPPDDDVVLTVNGGDMNHIKPFRRPDDKLWSGLKEEGWEPVLAAGTPTHYSGEKYKRSGRIFKALGRKSEQTQLDAVYARPRSGSALVNLRALPDAELTFHEIGYSNRTIQVEGTDHYAIETTYSLPIQQRPEVIEEELSHKPG